MANGVKRIIEQAYHRNGTMGSGFVVTRFTAYGHTTKFVAVSFQPRQDYATREEAVHDFIAHTAVLNIPELADGNIAFGKGNSWAGADEWGKDIAKAWAENPRHGSYDPFTELTPAAL